MEAVDSAMVANVAFALSVYRQRMISLVQGHRSEVPASSTSIRSHPAMVTHLLGGELLLQPASPDLPSDRAIENLFGASSETLPIEILETNSLSRR